MRSDQVTSDVGALMMGDTHGREVDRQWGLKKKKISYYVGGGVRSG